MEKPSREWEIAEGKLEFGYYRVLATFARTCKLTSVENRGFLLTTLNQLIEEPGHAEIAET